jgi:hypothetical protein
MNARWFGALHDLQLVTPPPGVGAGGAVLTRRALWAPIQDEWVRLAPAGSRWLDDLGDAGLWFRGAKGTQWHITPNGHTAYTDTAHIRVGLDVRVSRAPGGPWTCEQAALPDGAAHSKDLRPWTSGLGLCWTADDFLYRWDFARRPMALCAAQPFRCGPSGALLVGTAPWTHAAAPGGPLRLMPAPIPAQSVLSDGGRVLHIPEDTGVSRWDLQARLRIGHIASSPPPPADAQRGRFEVRGLRCTYRRQLAHAVHYWTADGAQISVGASSGVTPSS